MSLLGFMSVKVDREQTRLESLNKALLLVQSESLGRAADLGFTAEEIKEGKATLRDFINRLLQKLRDGQENGELEALVHRIREIRQIELPEWVDELAKLEDQLGQPVPLPQQSIPIVESVLGLLDEELTAEFNRLYSR